MFKGLSPRAQRILTILAQEEGQKNKSDQLLPEHIMLAIIKSADGLGYLTLQFLKVNILSFQLVLEQSLPVTTATLVFADIPPSRRLRTLLDMATIESRTLRQDYVGTEHLLLAAIREEQSTVANFFDKAGLTVDNVRRIVAQLSVKNTSSFFGDQQPVNNQTSLPIGHTFPVGAQGNPASQGRQNQQNQQNQQKKQGASLLAEFSKDFTAMAREGKLDPVIGRDKEIQRVVQILSRRNKNNPVLVGEPGVGKTAIVEGLAQRIVTNQVPRSLSGKRLLTLDLALVIAGTKYRGEFEERLKRIMKEISEAKDIILFIDELHTIIGAGGAEGTMDASNMLKPALSRGELQCIGATTLKEYRKYFEKDGALERRFQVVQVREPSIEDTRTILDGLKKKYEEYHGIIYDDEVIELIVRFSQRFLTERFFPDKAIDVLDEAGAMKKISADNRPSELAELEERINALNEEKQQLVTNQNYERAAQVRDEVRLLRQKLEDVRLYWQSQDQSRGNRVTVADISQVLSIITGIPLDQLDTSETSRLVNMEQELHKTVIGQHEAVSLITSAIRRSRAGVSSVKRPMGSFIFLGPTGVGKTLLAKTLAKFLFGTEESLVRIDMSDFMEKHNSSRLTGAPPGYIGYEDGGLLTEKIRRNPYSVVLLDEIEKAHPDIFNLLLQIFEEGELRDSFGQPVNFRNTVIIMTSNAGARQISNENRLGFNNLASGVMEYEEIKSSAMTELKKLMSPELINRLDDIVVFTPLCREEISAILDLQLKELQDRLAEKHISVKITEPARDYLIQKGYDPAFGARPMRRLIQREIEDQMALQIISGEGKEYSTVIIDFIDEGLKTSFKSPKKNKGTKKTMKEISQAPALKESML